MTRLRAGTILLIAIGAGLLLAGCADGGDARDGEPMLAPLPSGKEGSGDLEPTAVPHAAPDLEALLPDRIAGVALEKSSQTGVEMGLGADDPILAQFEKQPADLATATATPNRPPLLAVGVTRLRGVSAADLLAAQLNQVPADAVAETSLAGRPAKYVTHGAWPVWYVPAGQLLYAIVGTEEQAAEAAAALP